MASTVTSRQRLSERVADQLQTEILRSGVPNQKLPTEVELAEQYAVSRTVVREAARLLVQRGLVTVAPGRGMLVAEYDGRQIAEQFAMLMEASQGTFDQLLELRLALEIQMATAVALSDDSTTVELMRQTIEDGEKAVEDREQFLEADMRFHELLALGCGNPYFELAARPINRFLRKHYRNRLTYPSDPHRTLEEHVEILDALGRGDTLSAARATEQHLQRLRKSRRNDRG